jgi:hypothetical protein
MFIMLSRGDTLAIGNHSWHTTRRICTSNPHSSSLHSCVFVKYPSVNSFLGSPHLYSVFPSYNLVLLSQIHNASV